MIAIFLRKQAHEDRIKDMNDQADSLIESGQFDTAAIQVKSQFFLQHLCGVFTNGGKF